LVEPQADGNTFLATDLRFVEFWPEDTAGLPRTVFAWKVTPAEGGNPPVFEPYRTSLPEISGLFRAMRDHLQGDASALLPPSAAPSS
ncbi:MAG: hypothetical protein AAGH89_04600, partial [Verrucomicrobiota bacterium]